MKQLLLLVLMTVICIGGGAHIAQAENNTEIVPGVIESTFLQSIEQNATIDALYDFKTGAPLVGAGVALAQYKEGMVELRLEFASNLQGGSLIGGVISADPLKIIGLTRAKDWQWVASFTFKAGLGAMVATSGDSSIHPIGYLKLIEIF